MTTLSMLPTKDELLAFVGRPIVTPRSEARFKVMPLSLSVHLDIFGKAFTPVPGRELDVFLGFHLVYTFSVS